MLTDESLLSLRIFTLQIKAMGSKISKKQRKSKDDKIIDHQTGPYFEDMTIDKFTLLRVCGGTP